MTRIKINPDKIKLLDGFLKIYEQEIRVIHAIWLSWDLLSNEAKDICAEDFDKAIVAREAFLEEIALAKDSGAQMEHYEGQLKRADSILLQCELLAKDLYGLDVKKFLSIKEIKLIKK